MRTNLVQDYVIHALSNVPSLVMVAFRAKPVRGVLKVTVLIVATARRVESARQGISEAMMIICITFVMSVRKGFINRRLLKVSVHRACRESLVGSAPALTV